LIVSPICLTPNKPTIGRPDRSTTKNKAPSTPPQDLVKPTAESRLPAPPSQVIAINRTSPKRQLVTDTTLSSPVALSQPPQAQSTAGSDHPSHISTESRSSTAHYKARPIDYQISSCSRPQRCQEQIPNRKAGSSNNTNPASTIRK
jgi:hypothetical protein